MAKRKRAAGAKGQDSSSESSGPSEERLHFSRIFCRVCDSLGITMGEIESGNVELMDSEGHKAFICLDNLRSIASQYDPQEWPEVIRHHLNAAGPAARARMDEMRGAGLQSNRDKLLPCLKPGSTDRDSSQYWSRVLCWQHPDAEEVARAMYPNMATGEVARRTRKSSETISILNLMLVIDLPQSMAFVTAQSLTDSGQSAETWFKIAKQNLLARTPEEWFEVVDEDNEVCSPSVEDNYDTARMLLLDELLPGRAPRGWFVSPIARDSAYFMPVTDKTASDCLIQMKGTAQNGYENKDHAISREVFWVYEGKWHHFPIFHKNGETTLLAPPEYVRVFHSGPRTAENRSDPPLVASQPGMKIFQCPKCGQKMYIDLSSIGTKMRCPGCGVIGRVPQV